MAASRHPVNAGSRPLWWLPGSAATLLILLLSLGPLAALLWQAGTLSPRTLLADPYLRHVLGFSLGQALLSTLLPAATVNAGLAGGATGQAQVGGAYMVALADKFHDAIEANALSKGAQRVAVLNMPAIDKTPRLQQVLGGITATAGAAASAQVQGLLKAWLEAFNAQLDKRFAGNSKVVVVDFYTSFNDQVANPAQFGLTNAKNTVCPITGQGADGLPSYTFPTCTAAALSAQTPPAGATGGADWWKTYAFSDSFHPTPYGHQLVSQLVSRSLARAGWL